MVTIGSAPLILIRVWPSGHKLACTVESPVSFKKF